MATMFLRKRSHRKSYYARFLVPSLLHATLNRRELWKCLRTTSYQEARLKAGIWHGKLSRLILHLTHHHHRMTPEQVRLLVQQYISTTLQQCEDLRSRKVMSEDERDCEWHGITDVLEQTTTQLLQHDYSKITDDADELLQTHQVILDKATEEYQGFCRELLKARQAILKVELDRNEGDYTSSINVDGILAPAGRQGPTSFMPSKPFSEVVKVYFHEYPRQPRTDLQIRSGFEKFLEIIGGDRPVQEVTKALCRQYKETLLKLPRSMTVDQRKMPVAQLMKLLAKRPPSRTLGASTVNKYLHNLSHLFDWAKGQGFYEGENPVDGLIINKRQHGGKEKRKPFTDEDLALIFGSEGFTKQTKRHPERYWILLILLHTGARREEVAQLYVADVKQQDGVWYFDITPDEDLGKQVKTQGSKRRVPIHSALVKLGLLDYVEAMRKAKQMRLFPMLEKGRNGYGDAVGKWFGRYLNKLGITDPAKVIHSFRHTFVTKLTAAGVPQDMREVLVGHAAENVHGQTYVQREAIPLALLKEHLEKLEFTTLINHQTGQER